jgi:hypothetical protein
MSIDTVVTIVVMIKMKDNFKSPNATFNSGANILSVNRNTREKITDIIILIIRHELIILSALLGYIGK